MTNDITVYDLLISCPSDVSQYVELLERQIHLLTIFMDVKEYYSEKSILGKGFVFKTRYSPTGIIKRTNFEFYRYTF